MDRGAADNPSASVVQTSGCAWHNSEKPLGMALAEPTGTKGAPPVRAAAGVANAIVKLNTDTKKRATTNPVQMVAGLCSRSRYGSVTGTDKLIVNKDLMSINETMHTMRGARWRPMPGHRSQS